MIRSIVVYGIVIAAAAAGLQWLEYQHAIRFFRTELYVVLIAAAFTALGAWAGVRLARRRGPPRERPDPRQPGGAGISEREFEVLELLAAGHSNREIAEKLFVSPNTVKTHLASLYGKLGVSRRTQAVHKARALRLVR